MTRHRRYLSLGVGVLAALIYGGVTQLAVERARSESAGG